MDIIAIDPGAITTACFLPASDELGFIEASEPVTFAAMLKDLSRKRAPRVVCEHVTIRPGEDLNAGSKLVGSMYMVWGVCAALGLPVAFVAPAGWKKALHVPGKTKPGALKEICEMAGNVFPDARPFFAVPSRHHNRADAALLAHWYRTTLA